MAAAIFGGLGNTARLPRLKIQLPRPHLQAAVHPTSHPTVHQVAAGPLALPLPGSGPFPFPGYSGSAAGDRLRIPRFLQNLMTAMSGRSQPVSETGALAQHSDKTAHRSAGNGKQAASGGDPQSADPDELHQLVVEHGDAVYRLALSVVRDKSLAEDIAQETLIKAWLALPTFRGDSSLRGWILRIAHNTAISTIRRRRAVVIDPHDIPEAPTKIERSVESRVQSEVVMDDFVQALELLDDLSRSIVVLRELEGLSYDEIGQVLDVPLPTVKTRLLRARRKLGAALREWE